MPIKSVGKPMQPNQVSVRLVPSSEPFAEPPQIALASSRGHPETQQEPRRPAWAVSCVPGGKSCSSHVLDPSTQEPHHSAYTSVRKLRVLLLSSLTIPKSSPADRGLPLTPEQLTDRRGTLHLPDGSTTPVKAAVTAYQHLHKQSSCSNSAREACFQLLLLWEAWVILIIKFKLLTSFFRNIEKSEIENFTTKSQKIL